MGVNFETLISYIFLINGFEISKTAQTIFSKFCAGVAHITGLQVFPGKPLGVGGMSGYATDYYNMANDNNE